MYLVTNPLNRYFLIPKILFTNTYTMALIYFLPFKVNVLTSSNQLKVTNYPVLQSILQKLLKLNKFKLSYYQSTL